MAGKLLERNLEVSSHGTRNSMAMAPNMASTPPSLELIGPMLKVMARRIA